MQEHNPFNLEELENRLKHRDDAKSAATVRPQILQAISRELDIKPAPPTFWDAIWPLLTGLATAVILINLSLSAALSTDFIHPLRLTENSPPITPQAIRRAAPEISQSEAERMALVMSAADRIIPAPRVTGSITSVPANLEDLLEKLR